MPLLLSNVVWAESSHKGLIGPNLGPNPYEILVRDFLDKDLYDMLRALSEAPGYLTEKELCKAPGFKYSPVFETVLGKAMNDNFVEELYSDKDAPRGHEIGYTITLKGKRRLNRMKELIKLSRSPVTSFP